MSYMAVYMNKWTPPRKSRGIPGVSTRFSLRMEMSRLTRDGTAEPVSRDPSSQARTGTGKYLFFPVQLTTSRIGNLTRLIHTLLLYVMTIHTYIHTYIHTFLPFPLFLCMDYRVLLPSYVLSFRRVFFLPCDHGLFFLHHQLIYVRI